MSLPKITFEYATTYDDALHRAATEWGVIREFHDIFGQHHVSSAETEAKILASLGMDVSSVESVNSARSRRFVEGPRSVVPRTSVISEHEKSVELSLDGGRSSSIHLEV